jgi:hypothetical protein
MVKFCGRPDLNWKNRLGDNPVPAFPHLDSKGDGVRETASLSLGRPKDGWRDGRFAGSYRRFAPLK